MRHAIATQAWSETESALERHAGADDGDVARLRTAAEAASYVLHFRGFLLLRLL